MVSSNEGSEEQNKKNTLAEEEFRELRDLIYSKCGIYYTESKKYLLEERIFKKFSINRFKSYDEYISLLRSDDSREELNSLFEAITINETSFFRAEQQFEVFERIITPEIINVKRNIGSNKFRIWSAASSTGEEAYSLAMLINEKIKPNHPDIDFEIIGSDINNAVIETAKKGIYKEYSVKHVPELYLKKYFKVEGNSYILNNDIKQLVQFININLYDQNQMKIYTNFDVIFCCNVLIYFDKPSKEQVVSYLYDSLNKNGYLFVGYSESLHGISKDFKLIHLQRALSYKND